MDIVVSGIIVVLTVVVAVVAVRRADTARHAAEAARAEATTQRDAATAEAAAAEARAARADEERAAADERESRARKHASEVAGRVGDLTADLDRLRGDLAAREQVIVDLRAEVAAAHSTASTPRAEILWALELARVERTWRSSVAPDPTVPSGVIDAVDPVSAVLDIEAAAAREEIGTNVACAVVGFGEPDAARDVVAVRAVQEAIAHAARDADEVKIDVRADGDAIQIEIRADGDVCDVPVLTAWRAGEGYRL